MLQRSRKQASETGSDTASQTDRQDVPTGRKRLPHVSSMLFDLELEDQDSGDLDHNVGASPQTCALLKLLQPASQEEKQLGHIVNAAFEAAALDKKVPTIDQLADSLRRQGYDVRIRTALGGGGNQECLRNLRHNFLTTNLAGSDGQMCECIIDPSFAEQWNNTRSTAAYTALIDALPQVYVGTSVEPLVEFLCGELAESFKAEGVLLPPWRSKEAMLSKWRPRRSVDRDMGHTPSALISTAFLGSHVSRPSFRGRPSKAQRLDASGHSRGSASGSPSPRCSPPPDSSPSALSRGLLGFTSVLKPSASWSQLASQGRKQHPPTRLRQRQTGKRSEASSPVGGYDSSSSSDSSLSSDTAPLQRASACAALPSQCQAGCQCQGLEFSSSWRASDTVPFPQAAASLLSRPTPSLSGYDGRATEPVSQGGFGSLQSADVLDGRPGQNNRPGQGGLKKTQRNSLQAPAVWSDDHTGNNGGVSASDGSDTTQVLPKGSGHLWSGGPTAGSSSVIPHGSRLSPSLPDGIAAGRSFPFEGSEAVVSAKTYSNQPGDEGLSQFALPGGSSSNKQGTAQIAAVTRRSGSGSGRVAHRFKPLVGDDEWSMQMVLHRDHATSKAQVIRSDVATSMSVALPVASKVAAARESLSREHRRLLQ